LKKNLADLKPNGEYKNVVDTLFVADARNSSSGITCFPSMKNTSLGAVVVVGAVVGIVGDGVENVTFSAVIDVVFDSVVGVV